AAFPQVEAARDRDKARRLSAAVSEQAYPRGQAKHCPTREASAASLNAPQLDFAAGQKDDRVPPGAQAPRQFLAGLELGHPPKEVCGVARELFGIEVVVAAHPGGAIANRSSNFGCRKLSMSAIRPSSIRNTSTANGSAGAPDAPSRKTANAGWRFARVATCRC